MAAQILLIDDIHIGARQYPILFDFFKKNNISVCKCNKNDYIKSIHGTWFNKKNLLYPIAKKLFDLDYNDFFKHKHRGINLYDLYCHEIMAYACSTENWHSNMITRDEHVLKKRLFLEYNESVVYCAASAIFWIDFWIDRISLINRHSHSIIFSGCQIYQRAFLKVSEGLRTRPVLIEHFFTGSDFYFEERMSPLPNSTFASISPTMTELSLKYKARQVKNCIGKLQQPKNRNVRQPKSSNDILFKHGKTILIVGQVANDYSLIASENNFLSSIAFYRNLIESILSETDYNIIFKGHPWEEHKTNLNKDLTFQLITKHLHESLSKTQMARIKLVKNFNIYELFEQVDSVCGLCSQGCIEACLYGHKPAVFGAPFFQDKGFTSEYETVEKYIDDLKYDKIKKLTVNEFKSFSLYMTYVLEECLVSNISSPLLTETFGASKNICVKKSASTTNPTSTTKPTSITNTTNATCQKHSSLAEGCVNWKKLLQSSSEEFIDESYRIILNRTPDTSGRKHYLATLEKNEHSKEEVLLRLLASPESRMRNRIKDIPFSIIFKGTIATIRQKIIR